MATPKIVTELVERFDRNRELYCGSGYNETQLRREFLDPFFEALGWDVDNKRGVSPLYQDVVHEYGTEVEGSQKTADYAFRVGEKVKFFVEAKKPGTRLKDDAGPALQLRRYAYSASLPLSVLTDFEEFAAYDGRVPPKKADAASRARVMYFTYDRYVEAWEEIAAVFSREAVWSGAFDTHAEKTRGGKAEPVDKAFLKLLEGWRDDLARNVANRNREKDLDKYELSAAVQTILDRIIFLRVAEDRGIEDRGRLEALRTGEGVYGRLMELCHEADDVYNSGLFHFREEKGRATSRDELTPTLHVDDAILRKIIRELSESPYEFGVVPVEILGQVYEQFLGKTIWLDGRGVHIDYKPEVRKAKGVYYTPQYIVEYIVKNTVGELLKGCKRPRDAAKLKILDPACGSGSFLLGAYQHLINWHLEWYVDDGPDKHEGKVVPTPGPGPASWRLTAAAKKDILVDNLFGVDVDPQACEVTKLSLLLKALEGESRESVGAQTKLLRERILPDLGDNIKCGNSLIGSDYFEGGQTSMSVPQDEEERRRVNPFDWEVEFADIMKAGGFDAVISNPPYGASYSGQEKVYISSKYQCSVLRSESYMVFVEAASGKLTRGGLLGFIIPDTYLNLGFTQSLREYLLRNSFIKEIVVLPSAVFGGATVDTTLLFIERADLARQFHRHRTRIKLFEKKIPIKNVSEPYREFFKDTTIWYTQTAFNVLCDEHEEALITKIEDGKRILRYLSKIVSGIKAYEIGKGTPAQTRSIRDNKPFTSNIRETKEWEPFFEGKHIGRYQLLWEENSWVKYGPWLAAPREPANFDGEKILIRKIASEGLIATYIPNTSYCNTLLFVLKITETDYPYGFILGLLNSRLIAWYFKKKFQISPEDTFPQIMIRDIEQFPVPEPDAARHDKVVALVEEMLELHKRVAAAKSDADKKRIQRAVDATDRKIDALAYELYGLTEEEIKIVEGG